MAGWCFFFILFAVIFAIADGIRRDFSFGQFFLRFLILLEGYKVWDMIFLDWYLLTKSHFYQHYFPEVEGCESLKHTGFNRKEQLMKLCVIFPAIALALAGICTRDTRCVSAFFAGYQRMALVKDKFCSASRQACAGI